MRVCLCEREGLEISCRVNRTHTIAALKQQIYKTLHFPSSGMEIVYKGMTLTDDQSFGQLNASDGDCLVLLFNKKRWRQTRDAEAAAAATAGSNASATASAGAGDSKSGTSRGGLSFVALKISFPSFCVRCRTRRGAVGAAGTAARCSRRFGANFRCCAPRSHRAIERPVSGRNGSRDGYARSAHRSAERRWRWAWQCEWYRQCRQCHGAPYGPEQRRQRSVW